MVEKLLQDEKSWGRLHRMKWLSEIDQVKLVISQIMFDVRLLEAKNRMFKFDYQKANMFDSVQCLKKWCSSLLYE